MGSGWPFPPQPMNPALVVSHGVPLSIMGGKPISKGPFNCGRSPSWRILRKEGIKICRLTEMKGDPEAIMVMVRNEKVGEVAKKVRQKMEKVLDSL